MKSESEESVLKLLDYLSKGALASREFIILVIRNTISTNDVHKVYTMIPDPIKKEFHEIVGTCFEKIDCPDPIELGLEKEIVHAFHKVCNEHLQD